MAADDQEKLEPAKGEHAPEEAEKKAKEGKEPKAAKEGKEPKAAKEGKEPKAAKEGKEPKAAKEGKPGKAAKATKAATAAEPIKRAAPPRLRTRYETTVVPELMKKFDYSNRMQVPRLEKIVINFGLGEALVNPKLIDASVDELTQIAGQRPVVTASRKSIANFKLRQGVKIGAMVTLRRGHMWEFLDRLVTLALPRVRDFKGVSPRSFDGNGNYTLGLREQIIFPEINYDRVEKTKGMNVSIVTTARNDAEGRALLGLLGMPFRDADGAMIDKGA